MYKNLDIYMNGLLLFYMVLIFVIKNPIFASIYL